MICNSFGIDDIHAFGVICLNRKLVFRFVTFLIIFHPLSPRLRGTATLGSAASI